MWSFLQSLLAIANNDYQGPAKLEVFGKDEHVGWVRAGEERIDILTVEGEAIQVDARARFRLTPITWQELCGQCMLAKADRNYIVENLHSRIARESERVKERDSRIDDLRKALIRARVAIREATKPGALFWKAPIYVIDKLLEDALEADERDAFPF